MGRELVPSIDQGNFVVPVVEQGLDLRVYLNVLRRRYLFLIIPAVVVFAAVCVVTYLVLPSRYEAQAKILVESQLIPTDLAASTVTASATERIKLIEQRLTTRENLLEIARKYSLYPRQRRWASPSKIVDWIRDATKIEQIDLDPTQAQRARPGAEAVGFSLSFDYSDPVIAARVANELVASIMDQNIRSRQARATETSKFFDQQASKLEGDLAVLEKRIADFKKANEASLPETLDDRRKRLEQLQMQIADIDQRTALGTDPQGNVEATAQIKGLNSRLKAAQLQLKNAMEEESGLQSLLKKGYVTKTRLMDMENRIAQLQADIETFTGSITVAQNKLDESGGDPDFLPKKRADLAAQVATLNDSILKTPDVEASLGALSRDYENLHTAYTLAKSKTTLAATGQQMEEDRQAERFEVLEQASVPDDPISPDKPRILLAGAFGSIGAGVGLVILMEILDKSIRSTTDLERLLQIRPLMTIPYVTTPAERDRKKQTLQKWLFLIVSFVGLAIYLVNEFYLPLDILIRHLWQRFGSIG